MTTILVVTSLTHRALDQESLIRAWLKKGYRVVVLNFFKQDPFSIPHQFSNYKLISYDARPGAIQLAKTVGKIIATCWRYKVSTVISHLEYPSFVSVLASFFVRAKVIVYRHHADYAFLNGFDKSFSYKFTYQYAPTVIVVSSHAKKIMLEKEKISPEKIKVVPLAFDFGLFGKPGERDVLAIRRKYSATLLLLAVGRLTNLKRPYHSLGVLMKLLDHGLDVKLILLGVGEEQVALEQYIQKHGLQHNVFLPGFSKEVLTYMMASDFIIHPSVSESSSIIVKEAALVLKPCIVCQGVGDFDEYMVNNRNGFLVNPDNFVDEAVDIIKSNFQNKKFLDQLGGNLNLDILRRFEVSHVVGSYGSLFAE